jgi:hypothetical protein
MGKTREIGDNPRSIRGGPTSSFFLKYAEEHLFGKFYVFAGDFFQMDMVYAPMSAIATPLIFIDIVAGIVSAGENYPVPSPDEFQNNRLCNLKVQMVSL